MSKLVSLITPTRTEQGGNLHQALSSIKATASNFDAVEILLRIDDDDKPLIERIPSLEAEFSAKVFIGPRGQGYNDMGQFVDDLISIATGKWAWLFDDDAWLIGNTWQQQLEKIEPTENGPVCAAEWYALGGSQYHAIPKFSPPGLIIPMTLAKSLKHHNPVDDQWISETRRRGWEERPLMRIEYCHDGRSRG